MADNAVVADSVAGSCRMFRISSDSRLKVPFAFFAGAYLCQLSGKRRELS
jgi:hypothetical protein